MSITRDELRRQILSYLETHNTFTLATIGPDGPWAAALFYVNDAFDLYWLSDPDTRHSLNVARDARVAVTIQEDYRDWQVIQGIQMEGTAERVGPIAQAARPMALYVAKYPFLDNWRNLPQALLKAFGAAQMYRFTPSRLLFIDNTKGLGTRQEFELAP